jgi:tetratricopeptide (TPR) repeat protein
MVFFLTYIMKRRLLQFLVVGCLFLTVGIARSFGFSSEQATYTFRYAPENDGVIGTTNFFIRELARYNMATLQNTSFTYHYVDARKIEKTEPYTYKVTIALSGTNCSGDIHYRGFDISDILKPDNADFELIIVENGNYIHREMFSDIRAFDESFFATSVFESLDESGNFDVLVSDIRFYSDDSDKALFTRRINLIDSYYASIEAMDIIIGELSTLKYLPGQLIKNLVKVKESERILDVIKRSEFNHSINIDNHDVAGYRNKLAQFQMHLETARERLQRNVNAFDAINPKRTVAMIAETYVEEISRFFFRSQSVSHTLQSYYFGLGYVDFNASLISSLQTDLPELLRKAGYESITGFAIKKFKAEIFESFIDQANYFLEKEQFNVAKGLLINGSRFYQSVYGRSAPVELNILLSKSNYGIYNSYLHLIDRAVDIGNYGLAENYMEKATRFQAENTSTIISNNHILKITEKLVDLYISKGFNLTGKDEFKEAIYCFEQANRLCFSIKRFNHDYLIKHGIIRSLNGYYNQLLRKAGENMESGSLAKAKFQLDSAKELAERHPSQIIKSENINAIEHNLNYYVYLKEIEKGKKLLAENNFNKAYEHLHRAFELEVNSELQVYESVFELFSRSATPYLIHLCSLAEVKVMKNQLDEAREIYEHCFAMQREYGLNYEPALQASLALLNNNIFSKNCEIANLRLEEILDDFRRTVESADFVHALEVLNETNDLFAINYFCVFDKSQVAILEAQFKPAAKYQTLAGEAQKALSENDKQRFTELYKEMEILSQSHEVIRKRIEPLPLHYLFSVKKNLAFLETLINDYQSLEEFETGVKILHVLAANSYSGKDVKNIQQQLAQKLAAVDKASDVTVDPRKNVEQYTGGNTWFRHFKKVYLNSW